MKKLFRGIWISVLMALAAMVSGNVYAKGGFVDISFELPSPDPTLSIEITNPWWPLDPGDQFVYFEEEECILGIVDVLSWIVPYDKIIKGVRVLTVLDREYEYIGAEEDCDEGVTNYETPTGDWELLETTFDWYAQDNGGNVWYFGEDTIAFDHDECDRWVTDEDHPEDGCRDGSWEAGADVAGIGVPVDEVLEGIIMLASPKKGRFYFQEYYEDEAEDMGKVLSFKPVDDTIYDDLEHCVVIKEWVPLDPGSIEHKYYCEGYGLVLIEGNAGGPTVYEELIDGPPRD